MKEKARQVLVFCDLLLSNEGTEKDEPLGGGFHLSKPDVTLGFPHFSVKIWARNRPPKKVAVPHRSPLSLRPRTRECFC
jgi:hypothetical protein